MNIDWMTRRDMPEVLAIENDCFEFPWSESTFVEQLRMRNIAGMVAEHDNQVVGFMVYELNRNYLRLLNIAVHSAFRRQLVGTTMIEKLKGKLSQQKRQSITAEVRESNYAAQLWLKSLGFICVEQIKEFYEESHESAYRFRYGICQPIPIKQLLKNRVSELSQ